MGSPAVVAHRGRFVAYYRVSTEKQGRSGLGLEAQQAAVQDYLNGGTWELVGEFIARAIAKALNARHWDGRIPEVGHLILL